MCGPAKTQEWVSFVRAGRQRRAHDYPTRPARVRKALRPANALAVQAVAPDLELDALDAEMTDRHRRCSRVMTRGSRPVTLADRSLGRPCGRSGRPSVVGFP